MAKRKPKRNTAKKCEASPLVTEQYLIAELNEELIEAWHKLRDFASSLGEQRIYASHKCIMFSRKVCYCFVRPKKSFLEVCIFLPRQIASPIIKRSNGVSKSKFANMYQLKHADQVEQPLTDWIREAFSATNP